jgi:hypothetical protein
MDTVDETKVKDDLDAAERAFGNAVAACQTWLNSRFGIGSKPPAWLGELVSAQGLLIELHRQVTDATKVAATRRAGTTNADLTAKGWTPTVLWSKSETGGGLTEVEALAAQAAAEAKAAEIAAAEAAAIEKAKGNVSP